MIARENLYFVANYLRRSGYFSAEDLSSLNVAQSGEHPRVQVAKQMAVECPPARVVRIECYDNACPGRHQHGITHRPWNRLPLISTT
jgi:hypothetical protein